MNQAPKTGIRVGQTPPLAGQASQSRAMAAIGWLAVFAIAVLIPIFTLKYAGPGSHRD